jgi:hypothetical protein
MGRVYPDDTTILDWYYLFRHDFGAGNAPDYVVLSYALQQLADGSAIHSDRIAGYFGGWSNAAEILTRDLTSLNERVDYVLSSAFRLWSERERVRSRVLGVATPDYLETARRLNDTVRATSASGANAPVTYSRLRRFLALCAERGTRVVVVAMPQPNSYALDPGLEAVLAQGKAQLLDMRSGEGLSADDYADGYHLSPRGAERYSEVLGRRLGEVIPACGPGTLPPASHESPR